MICYYYFTAQVYGQRALFILYESTLFILYESTLFILYESTLFIHTV